MKELKWLHEFIRNFSRRSSASTAEELIEDIRRYGPEMPQNMVFTLDAPRVAFLYTINEFTVLSVDRNSVLWRNHNILRRLFNMKSQHDLYGPRSAYRAQFDDGEFFRFDYNRDSQSVNIIIPEATLEEAANRLEEILGF